MSPKSSNRATKTPNPRVAFGAVLRSLRERASYSQDSFAHFTGYHRNYIGQLERGEKSPSLTAIFNLSKAFNLRPSRLLELVERELFPKIYPTD